MTKGRLEAFSDGVIAIIITIMVLELKSPEGDTLRDLLPVLPHFFSYLLSFLYVGIYWNNHHHLLHTVQHVTGRVLWANLHLLFWLSLIPFTTAWMSEHEFAPAPLALYGADLFMTGLAYYLLTQTLISVHPKDSLLRKAVGRHDQKALMSCIAYMLAIGLAWVDYRLSFACYMAIAKLWFTPDERIEQALADEHPSA